MSAETDRELLELAAKAAEKWKSDFELDDDYEPVYDEEKGFRLAWGKGWWNPRSDDGDAIRLLAAIPSLWSLSMNFGPMMTLDVAWGTGRGIQAHRNPNEHGRAEAIRYVIVRAAAEIGKAM